VDSAYEVILKTAHTRKKENKKFLEKLRDKKPADLDRVTNEIHDQVFEKINCLECANCCRGTGPLLRSRDVERLASHQKIRPAVFTEKYLRIDEDNDYVFKSMPCPFLRTDNYCSAYEARPNACREFPHTSQKDIRQKLGITLLNTMVCPGVALIVDQLKIVYSKL
jgi:uncharacterized protein